jgi:hypothetical protein
LCQQQLLSELAQAKLVVQVQDLKQVAKYVHRNQQVFELKMTDYSFQLPAKTL